MVGIVVSSIDLFNPGWRSVVIFRLWAIVAVFLVMGSSLALLISQNWRRFVVGLSIQYLAVFWLVALAWPVGLAAVKLVVGWMAGAVLGASNPEVDLKYSNSGGISGSLFRLLAAGMVWILCFSIAPALTSWIPASMVILWSGLILIGMGLLQLGMTTRPLRVVVGLLTILSGFEVLYATVETSVLVAGLLTVINLGLALVGAYLLATQTAGETA